MTPLILALLFALYLVGGALLGLMYDTDEMKKAVPYAHMPHLLTLGKTREVTVVTCAVIGIPCVIGVLFVFIAVAIVDFYLEKKIRFHIWWLKRQLDQVTKMRAKADRLSEAVKQSHEELQNSVKRWNERKQRTHDRAI